MANFNKFFQNLLTGKGLLLLLITIVLIMLSSFSLKLFYNYTFVTEIKDFLNLGHIKISKFLLVTIVITFILGLPSSLYVNEILYNSFGKKIIGRE